MFIKRIASRVSQNVNSIYNSNVLIFDFSIKLILTPLLHIKLMIYFHWIYLTKQLFISLSTLIFLNKSYKYNSIVILFIEIVKKYFKTDLRSLTLCYIKLSFHFNQHTAA